MLYFDYILVKLLSKGSQTKYNGGEKHTMPNKESNSNQDSVIQPSNNKDEGLNFEDEFENLQAGSQWFNPEEGTHKVTFLDNGKEEERTYDNETRKVAVFTVEVEGEELKWSVTKGVSESSLFGQLMKYGAAAQGLKGETITLIRSGQGQDTQYTVQEAADI